MARVRHAMLVLAALLGGCDALDREGILLVTDQTYSAVLVATNKDGIAGADGLLWRDGRLYMADERGGAVRVRGKAGESTTLAGRALGISSPEDLAMDAAGNLFFTDDDAGGLWTIDPKGKASLVAGKDKGLASTEGIALSPSGAVLVGDAARHRILRVDRGGGVTIFLGAERGIGKPESLAYDGRGNLYIADNDADILYRLAPDGRLHAPIRGRDGFSPETIFHAGGTLYVTDSKNGKLFGYTPEDGLKTIAVFGGALAIVCGVTVDDRGNIYLSIQTDPKDGRAYILRLERKPRR